METFPIRLFERTKCELNVIMPDCEIDEVLKENLKKLRLEHINKEEYNAITKLCYEYHDILHRKKNSQSFTNQIKQNI